MWFIASDVGWLVPRRDERDATWPAFVSKWEDAWGFKSRADADVAAFTVAAQHPDLIQNLTVHEIDRWMVVTSTGASILGVKLKFGDGWNRLFWSEGMKAWYYGWANGTKFETMDQAVRARDIGIRTVQALESVAVVRRLDDCYGL